VGASHDSIKIEVTPKMIAAGLEELRTKTFGEPLQEILTDVFLAMSLASQER
jgi:hypothetical protein